MSAEFRLAPGRPPAVGSAAMVSASNPFAVQAGLRMLERGGNAVDAALAAAAMLCITEPMNIGVGGDTFALVADGGSVFGLDAAGPAPATIDDVVAVAQRGPRSVTVPGAVAGWAALAERFGRLGLDACLSDAIDAAEQGVPVCQRVGALWVAEQPCPEGVGPAEPRVGQRVRMPALAGTLRAIAETGPGAIYSGPIARAIASATWLTESDLADYRPRWVSPLRAPYRRHEVIELPPPTQGVVALEALRLLEMGEVTLSHMIHCVALALDDGAAHVRDGAHVGRLLEQDFLESRLGQVARPVSAIDAGTSHLCVVDGDRQAISFIGSLFGSFGSGVVAPRTGIALQNRGACFAVEGRVRPGQRPYHTIIPGMIADTDGTHTAFGVVGGHLQAQAHVQLVSALLDEGLDAQAALDRSRFRIDGEVVLLEEGLWPAADTVRTAGYEPTLSRDWMRFGCGQVIQIEGEVLLGGADPRMDGYAAGL
jgi:gamma-glutamyltranspeptidase / glutathione hydrolase